MSTDNCTVALKVLKSGSLSALQREVDVLNTVDHPSIVKIIDHGRFPTGEVYLAMSFVNGPTLRSHCNRATRLSPAATVTVLVSLLEALVELHPNQGRLEELRLKSELSVQEFHELEIARHGYLHRDIKPDNVVLDEARRPVLIDFGISVRASSPVLTRSATEGYLPPDGLPGHWSVDVDLYQLGLTMLQVSTGIEYSNGNVDDLRTLANNEAPEPLKRVLLQLTAPTRSERYQSAQAALADLSTAR